MNPDIENKILDNILTQEQIDRIYKAVEICPKEKIGNSKTRTSILNLIFKSF